MNHSENSVNVFPEVTLIPLTASSVPLEALHQSIMSLNVFLLLSFSLFSTTNVRSVIIT